MDRFFSKCVRQREVLQTLVADKVKEQRAVPSPRDTKKYKRQKERNTYRAQIAYYGTPFQGYSWLKGGEKTIEGVLQEKLSTLDPERKTWAVNCSGRTDRGVHAVGQNCSFYSWKDFSLQEVLQALQKGDEDLVAYEVAKVPRSFHATFSCCWRYYMYIVPKIKGVSDKSDEDEVVSQAWQRESKLTAEHLRSLLKPLEGEHSFNAFARDTPPGKNVQCHMYYTDITETTLLSEDGEEEVYCIHLVGNRFLKRMVRVIVSTLMKEAIELSESESRGMEGDDGERKKKYLKLLELADSEDRELTQPAAPGCGLCLAEAGYSPWIETKPESRE